MKRWSSASKNLTAKRQRLDSNSNLSHSKCPWLCCCTHSPCPGDHHSLVHGPLLWLVLHQPRMTTWEARRPPTWGQRWSFYQAQVLWKEPHAHNKAQETSVWVLGTKKDLLLHFTQKTTSPGLRSPPKIPFPLGCLSIHPSILCSQSLTPKD